MRSWTEELLELTQSSRLFPDCGAFWITALGPSNLFVHRLRLQQSCSPLWSCCSHFSKYAMLCLLQESAKEEVPTVQKYRLDFFADNGWNLKQENTLSLLHSNFSSKGEFNMDPRTQNNRDNINREIFLARPAVLTTGKVSSITSSLTAWPEQHRRRYNICFTE